MAEKECCGTCRFHRIDDDGEWICVNEDSEYYTDYTEYGDWCEEHEEKV